MRNEGGVVVKTGPFGIEESSTFTCFHCNSIHIVRPKQRPEDTGGLCKQCMKLICPHCVDTGTCTPFEKRLEEMEASYHARRSYGLA